VRFGLTLGVGALQMLFYSTMKVKENHIQQATHLHGGDDGGVFGGGRLGVAHHEVPVREQLPRERELLVLVRHAAQARVGSHSGIIV